GKFSGLGAYINQNQSSSDFAALAVSILQGPRTMLIVDREWAGRGSIATKTNGYRLSARGVGSNRGNILALTGSLGPHTNNFQGNTLIFNATVTMNGQRKLSR